MNNKKNNAIMKILKNSLVNLHTPSSITYMWNWGSLLGVCLAVQLITGILLASQYEPSTSLAFKSVIDITRNVNYGFELRYIHMNMASAFFMSVFIHMSRSLFMSSFKNKTTWLSGMAILLILMATAFMGYVLPWGQMSFWGATVITNLLSAIPYVGETAVKWLWGGFSIGQATLNRFFSLHFLMPMVISALVMIHLLFLHQMGSSKPSGMKSNMDKIMFHPYFSIKDTPPALILVLICVIISFFLPFNMGDPENFNPANPLNTPIHIQPEWYFLFAYAILRSIPNKLGGVVGLIMSIICLAFLIMFKKNITSKKWTPNKKMFLWWYFSIFILLTWAGAMPVEMPYEASGKALSLAYFSTVTMICFY